MANRLISPWRLDLLAVAVILATAAAVRVVLGYGPFPFVDDYTYIPLGWALLDPEMFPRDEILRGYVNHIPLWPPIIWIAERTLGLAETLLLLTLLLTLGTVYFLRQLLRSLGGSDWFLPLVVLLSVTVSVQGIGRGSYGGIIGEVFHLQWLALAVVLGAYHAFVRGKPLQSGLFLGGAAWCHPLVAFHGAICLAVSGLFNRTRGLVDTLKAGAVSFLVSLPLIISLAGKALQGRGEEPDPGGSFIRETALFRTPHHYDLGILPFLFAALLGLLALSAIPRITGRGLPVSRRFYGILLGHGFLLLATFLLHGPFHSRGQDPFPFWVYALDLSRTTPLFFALCGIAVAAALPRQDEDLAPGRFRGIGDRVFAFSAMLATGFLLLVNFLTVRYILWVYPLGLLALISYIWDRRGKDGRVMAAALLAFAGLAGAGFVGDLEIRSVPGEQENDLYQWAMHETPRDALFIIPPGLEAFRLEAQRSVYVDFKSFPPSQPDLGREWRRRLEEIVGHDAKALEQARGWEGLFWWDLAYAKRNSPERISDLLTSTGADFFVQDRLFLRLPPHLPTDDETLNSGGWRVSFENSRYRVFTAGPRP